MQVTVLKKDRRYDTKNDTFLGIQTYGESNDYPQQVMQIVDASSTGKTCVSVYAKFIAGRGFIDTNFFGLVVNRKRQTNDYLLSCTTKDLAEFGGFAIHVNYNRNFLISEVQYIPFEQVRFGKLDGQGKFDKVAIHQDWAKQFIKLHKFSKDDITIIDFYNPDPEVIASQVEIAGGWDKYKGQVYYYSNEGERVYPTPLLDVALTDMNSEEGVSNVSNRNVRNNFLAAGMFLDYGGAPDENEEQEDTTEEDLLQYQGDENACKIMYLKINDPEKEPKFVTFKGTNYASEFGATEKSVQANIGKVFNQPPVLRAENVSANFGADVIKNGYNYYNSVTEPERLLLERTFTEIFSHWFEPLQVSYQINPLSYEVEMTFAERIGTEGVTQLIAILESTALTPNNKRQIIRTLFAPTPEELDGLAPATI